MNKNNTRNKYQFVKGKITGLALKMRWISYVSLYRLISQRNVKIWLFRNAKLFVGTSWQC